MLRKTRRERRTEILRQSKSWTKRKREMLLPETQIKSPKETEILGVRGGHRGAQRDRDTVRRDPAREETAEVSLHGPGTVVE